MRRRGEGGFRAAGSFSAEAAGLPKTLTKKLELLRAWRAVAGPILADRARAVQILRGTLELEVADPAWARQVVPLLPAIAARLARAAPQLGIRKFRIGVAGAVRVPRSPVPEDTSEAPEPSPRAALAAVAPELAPPSNPAERIEELARRYLAAAARRDQRKRG